MIKNILYNEDCLMGMEHLPSGCVDMILCDLPYGTTQNKWDTIINLSELWLAYKRIIKSNGVIALTAQTPFDKVLGCSNLAMLKYELIWQKNVATGHLNANRAPMKLHENILIFYNGTPCFNKQMVPGAPYKNKRKPIDDNGDNYGTIIRTDTVNSGDRNPVSIIQFNREVGLHPTQKPVPLFEYLIKTYSNEGDTILDTCMGSGTTAVACVKTKRHYIGFELDTNYCNQAKKRIQEAINNL